VFKVLLFDEISELWESVLNIFAEDSYVFIVLSYVGDSFEFILLDSNSVEAIPELVLLAIFGLILVDSNSVEDKSDLELVVVSGLIIDDPYPVDVTPELESFIISKLIFVVSIPVEDKSEFVLVDSIPEFKSFEFVSVDSLLNFSFVPIISDSISELLYVLDVYAVSGLNLFVVDSISFSGGEIVDDCLILVVSNSVDEYSELVLVIISGMILFDSNPVDDAPESELGLIKLESNLFESDPNIRLSVEVLIVFISDEISELDISLLFELDSIIFSLDLEKSELCSLKSLESNFLLSESEFIIELDFIAAVSESEKPKYFLSLSSFKSLLFKDDLIFVFSSVEETVESAVSLLKLPLTFVDSEFISEESDLKLSFSFWVDSGIISELELSFILEDDSVLE